MKKNQRFFNSAALIAVTTAFVLAVPFHTYAGENILYDGTDPSLLRQRSGDDDASLFPGNGVNTELSGNTVTVSKKKGEHSFRTPSSVIGGVSLVNGTVSSNTVNIEGGSVGWGVMGGYIHRRPRTDSADKDDVHGEFVYSDNRDNTVSDNTLNITGGSMSGDVYGGKFYNEKIVVLQNGTVSGNTIKISGGLIKKDAYGGYGNNSNGDSTVSGNNVIISGGSIADNIYGGYGKSIDKYSMVSGNTVIISGGSIGRKVYGGYNNDSFVKSLVSGNTVNMKGGSVMSSVFGGFGKSSLADSVVSYNTVNITGGSIDYNVYGGFNYIDNKGSTANHNTVIVAGNNTEIGGSVYGGYVTDKLRDIYSKTPPSGSTGQGDDTYARADKKSKAIYNTVSLAGDQVRIGGSVYGGYTPGVAGSDMFSGNRLELVGFRGNLGGIGNFEYYHFVLPRNVVNGDVLVHITGTGKVDLADSKHTIAMFNDGKLLNSGDRIILIDRVTGTPTLMSHKVQQGQFIIYDMDLGVDEDKLVLSVKSKTDNLRFRRDAVAASSVGGAGAALPSLHLNPQSAIFLQGQVASLGFVAQGSDFVVGKALDAARFASGAGNTSAGSSGLSPFIISHGLSQRYGSAEHVDVKGFNMVLGFSGGHTSASGHALTLGAFAEYGNSSYEGLNSFEASSSSFSIRSSGDVRYLGGGVLFRIDFSGTGSGRVKLSDPFAVDGLYMSSFLRAGRVEMNFSTSAGIDPEGHRSQYASKAFYYGGHAGIGYVLNLDEKQSVDVYGRYLLTRIGRDTVIIGKDRLDLDSVTGSRVQLGARYSYSHNERFRPYVGVVYEHEFKGGVGGAAYGLRLGNASLKGGTGIFEAGLRIGSGKSLKGLSADFSVQGLVGRRTGGSGVFRLNYRY